MNEAAKVVECAVEAHYIEHSDFYLSVFPSLQNEYFSIMKPCFVYFSGQDRSVVIVIQLILKQLNSSYTVRISVHPNLATLKLLKKVQ